MRNVTVLLKDALACVGMSQAMKPVYGSHIKITQNESRFMIDLHSHTHKSKIPHIQVWFLSPFCLVTPVCPPDESASSWETPSALSVSLASGSPGSPGTGSGPGAQPEWVDCIQASDMCNQDAYCSSRYRVMRQCLVGKEKEAMLDNNRECQAALEVLLVSPLYDCRCKRGMKKELQCLQNYWTIHMGLTEGRTQTVLLFSVSQIHIMFNCVAISQPAT